MPSCSKATLSELNVFQLKLSLTKSGTLFFLYGLLKQKKSTEKSNEHIDQEIVYQNNDEKIGLAFTILRPFLC